MLTRLTSKEELLNENELKSTKAGFIGCTISKEDNSGSHL